MGYEYFKYMALVVLIAIVARELIYRTLYIYPRTALNGRYAAHIEQNDIFNWVAPVFCSDTRYDLLFLGNSHVMDAIDPEILTKRTGLKAYNLALYSIQLPTILHLLEVKGCAPKYLFIDISTRYCMYDHSYYTVACNEIDNVMRQRNKTLWRLRQELVDRLHTVLPSFFVPSPYNQLVWRTIKKLKRYKANGIYDMARYTPLRLLTSYDYSVDKHTNHRIIRRRKNRTRWEKTTEEFYLKLTIDETLEKCPIDSLGYAESMHLTESDIRKLRSKRVKVFFIRLPLDERLVIHENKGFQRYFEDIKKIAESCECDYIDLNEAPHRQALGRLDFYSDGCHLTHTSAEVISNYLAGFCENLGKN